MTTAPRSHSTSMLVITGVVAALLGATAGFLLSGGGRKALPAASSAFVTGTPAPPSRLEVGETGVTARDAEVTVLGWTPETPGWGDPLPGKEYSKVWVRFCSGAAMQTFGIRQIPRFFSVIDSEGKQLPTVVGFYSQHDELTSYTTGLLPPSTCATGSVVFETAEDAPIETVRFTGAGQFDWDISGLTTAPSPSPVPSISPGISPAPLEPQG